jgi:hypothetical protein
MKKLKLAPVAEEFQLFSHKFIVKYTDLTAAGLTQTLVLLPNTGIMPINTAIIRTGYRLVTPFTGGSVATVTLDLGDAQTAARYIAAATTDLLTAIATNTKNNLISATGYAFSGSNFANSHNKLQALFTSTVGNLNTLTAGEVEIYAKIVDLNDLLRTQ